MSEACEDRDGQDIRPTDTLRFFWPSSRHVGTWHFFHECRAQITRRGGDARHNARMQRYALQHPTRQIY